MKKLIPVLLLCAACRSASRNGVYINHSTGVYAVTDDTLIVNDAVVVNKTGYQKIRHGRLLPKTVNIRSWALNGPDAPTMRFGVQQITIGQTLYQRIP